MKPDSLDISFTVPFTHRVRFTDDVFGSDVHVLLDVLHALDAAPARVLACVESAVDAAAGLTATLRGWAARHADRVELIDVLSLPGGEALKNDPAALRLVLQAILDGNVDRQSYLLAIGGGAFLDAVGLAAALAHRGIRLVRLPTTTLSQADSGIGVKNAVNFFGKKNWLGTFTVPWAVINDRALLRTLADRDWRAGFSEAVKIALLKDSALFDQLCRAAPAIHHRDWPASFPILHRSALLHLEHIARGGDPFESREARPLDFGHWSAHRLEAMTNFTLRHGEAVAVGLAIDVAYSRRLFGFPPAREQQLLRCLLDLGLPLHHPALADADSLLSGLEEFRQHLGGRLTLTLLRDVGQPIDVHEIDLPTMRHAIEAVRTAASLT